jgi:hypothetical protein
MKTLVSRILAVAVIALVFGARSDAVTPAGRYTYPTPDTVFDTKTRLTWQRNPMPPGGTPNCFSLMLDGPASWRIPSMKELLTLVDYSKTSGPKVDTVAFPTLPGGVFRSSTSAPGFSSWTVDFSRGSTALAGGQPLSTICVR